ncbi:MAG: outer membrane lipoprotein-sorting protein [Verrucomicrobiota bacterium]
MVWPKQVKARIAILMLGAMGATFSFDALHAQELNAFGGFMLGVAQFTAVTQAAAQEASARQILAMVRANESGQNRDVTGQLQMSTADGTLRIPFLLRMRGGNITYQFSNPPEAFVLRMGENGSRLDRITGSGKSEKITGAKLDDLVRGTDISYEDLALKFLYWNKARVAGEENINISRCWVIDAVPSGKDDSQYDRVRLWVEKSGGLLRAECYAGGKLVRRFAVIGVQHDRQGKGYILKKMRIETMDGRGRDHAPTYLEVRQ